MEWPQLIIALVVVAAYVIKHILSAQQEAAAQRERGLVKNPPKPAVVTKTDEEVAGARTELDRRIEEAIERRRDLESGAPPVVTTVKKHIPMPVPRYQSPAAPAPPPPVAAPAVRPAPVAAPPPPPVVLPVGAPPVRVLAPAARRALGLLRDRDALATAFVLQEVLGRPLSLRRRRRP